MKRTLNYTNRKRITREQISIIPNREQGVIKSFDASIQLTGIELPDDAIIYVEAYHRTDLARFCFSTVGNPAPPEVTDLSHLSRSENLGFRVLVVDESSERGLILAVVDGIFPIAEGKDISRKREILLVERKDLGRQVWRLAYGDRLPTLQINNNIRAP